MWDLRIEKRAKYWFLRAICFFVLPSAVGLSPRNLPWHLLPLSCRRWAVVKGLAVAPATEPATVLTAALPWYLAPELPTLTAANGRRATCHRVYRRTVCHRRAYRRTACQRACRRAYCRRSTCRRATCHRAYRRNTVASAAVLTAVLPCYLPPCLPPHRAVGPTAPSGGKRSGRRRPPQVCQGVSLPGLWPLGQGL